MYILASVWFTNLIKQFFFWIDKMVYNFIPSIYDLMISIARTSVLTQTDIADMADRIYKLLAIFMIFKVTLSLVTYVVNPDDFSDKSKGVSKLGLNIIISLALLILTPYIFNYAYELQTIILEDNSLATLIFGEETSEEKSFFNSAGDDMAYITMSAFFSPNTAITELQDCTTLMERDNDSDRYVFNDACSGLTLSDGTFQDTGNANSLYGIVEAGAKDFSENDLKNYITGVENNSLGLMFRQNLVIARDKNDNYIMEYKFIISTVVGVVIILLLITFCMDVAVRSIKLAFLQLLAPIPIISYVDPKSGKDGLFKKWYEMCFKTYLSLFLRLIALYFAVYIISRVAAMKMVDIIDGSYQTNCLVAIFIIIGALMFAKQLPEILKGLGIKLDGDGKFTLNPLRKMEKEALGGKLLKKPNDTLGKIGKSIVKAPFTGISTLGKKGIAGAYSAANGSGFHRGWSSVDTPFKRALNKKIDEWAPDFAKDRQESRVAKLDALESERKDKKVEKYFLNDRKEGKKQFEEDMGKIDSTYRKFYVEAEQKKVEMYRAQASSNRWISAINNGQFTEEQRKILSESFNSGGRLMTDNELIQSLQKASGTAEKVYKKAEDAKENYGKTSSSARRAAALDKAYDSYDKLHPAEGTGYIPNYSVTTPSTEESVETTETTSENSINSSSNSTIESLPSQQNVLDRVEEITGVSQPSTVDIGAYDPENSAIQEFYDTNTSEDEKKRRIKIEERIREILTELDKLNREKLTTPDGEKFMECVRKIKELNQELENLRSQL